MCQSKANGGRRCDISKTLKAKIDKRDYIKKYSDEETTELDNEINELETKHKEHNEEQKAKEVKKQERKKLEQEREARRVEREERRKNEEALKNEEKPKEKARNAAQVYLSRQEHRQLQEYATNALIEDKKKKGTLENFLNVAVSRKAKKDNTDYTPYEEWTKTNGDDPQGYLKANHLDIREAGKLTHERVYDGIRERIEGNVTLTELGTESVTGEYYREKATRNVCGRVHTNYGSDDASTRSEKTDILLTDNGRYRVERIAKIFGIKKSDALRNQALGIDHRIRQHHQAVSSYETRRNNIAQYEKEGGMYRKQGETLDSLYERLIDDDSIVL